MTWILFWQLLFICALLIFAGVSALVIWKGWQDIRDLMQNNYSDHS